MHARIEAMLTGSPVGYRVHEHARLTRPIRTAQDFADALGYDLSRITKTLFLKGDVPGTYALAVCSMGKKVQFALLAATLGCKRMQVASSEELQEKIGYPPNGVSPLAVEQFPVFLDEALMGLETVLIGAGEAGVEIELAPGDLQSLTQAMVMKFAI